TASAKPRPLWLRTLPLAITALATAAVTAEVIWNLRPTTSPPVVTRFSIPVAQEQPFTNPGRHVVAISPDGRHIVYTANLRLYLRSLSELDAKAIPGTEAPQVTSPAFSPDGRFVVFFSYASLKKVAITGGAAVTLCPAANPWGISWRDDHILFGQG